MMLRKTIYSDIKMTEDTKDALSLTDEEDNDEFEDENQPQELADSLSKWTNYIHGWQDRYIVLKDGTLSYYKSENDTAFGCRGAVSLSKAVITPHEFDECRFDVNVNDCLWYLRTQNLHERQRWIDTLELHRQADSGYGSENSLRRHGSVLSLTSATSLSTTSTSSFKRGRGLREKLAEMETFKDILCRQVDTLQSYFDACASALANHTIHDIENDDIDDVDDLDPPHKTGSGEGRHTFSPSEPSDIVNILQQHGAHAIDFKGESYTFKATTAGILATLSHCIDLMGQREEAWRKRLEREVEKRKRVEEAYKAVARERHKPMVIGGPDYEEGPHSIINEDEFFDAVDATLDKMERDEEKHKSKVSVHTEKAQTKAPVTSADPTHRLYKEVNQVVHDHIESTGGVGGGEGENWLLIAEEGTMKVYKKEMEEDGMVVDPLKAVHTVQGITGHELCQYFWDPEFRMDWEGTLESTKTLEWVSKDTVITYQVHKRVWPASQRDTLFWSTIRHCPNEDEEGPDYWIVVNHSMDDHADTPSNPKCVRVLFNIAMICQTLVHPPENGQEIQRDNLTCKIQYSANVNPGGWAPASVIKLISKRELPKFLKTFTAYVQEKVQDTPIMF